MKQGLDWLTPRQVLDLKGDWAAKAPDVRPGGWAFQYNNAHYPDLDDTAVVVMAMDRARRASGSKEYDEAISRGREWIEGLQSRDGGWAAFDEQPRILPQQHPVLRPRRAARSADRGRPRAASRCWRNSARPQRPIRRGGRDRLSRRTSYRRVVVRPLGLNTLRTWRCSVR